MRIIAIVVLLALVAPVAARAEQGATAAPDSRESNLRAYVELLRSDLRTQKVAIIAEMMQFNEADDKRFWPIYREYEVELAKINDDRIALIKDYAASFEAMTDASADRIALAALDVEARRQELKSKYYARFKAALSPLMAAKFLQVENQLLLLLDLQIAASLPVVR
jgi:hypothetical protein